MTARILALASTIAAALVLSACGLEDPYDDRERASTSTAPVSEARTPGASPRDERSALETFAQAWIEWTATGSSEARSRLMALAGPALREDLTRRTRRGPGGVPGSHSEGSVEAVVLRDAAEALVVTLQTTAFAAGGEQSDYSIYLARARRADGAWKVVKWQPVL